MAKTPRRAALEQIAATEHLIDFYDSLERDCLKEAQRAVTEREKWQLALAKTKQRLEMMDADDMQALRQG